MLPLLNLEKECLLVQKSLLDQKGCTNLLDRLVTSALPRVRDFQGIKTSAFDGRGNYNLGITEQIIFPK